MLQRNNYYTLKPSFQGLLSQYKRCKIDFVLRGQCWLEKIKFFGSFICAQEINVLFVHFISHRFYDFVSDWNV